MVRVFNIQGRGYPNDNGVAALARDLGTVFDVDGRPKTES
jgi:hypothetical protein